MWFESASSTATMGLDRIFWPLQRSSPGTGQTTFANVVCPVPGLDRCNGQNILSSPIVAVDDADSNHMYYSFTTSTGAGNEDLMLFDSVNGGANFPRSVRVNSAVAGRRFL